MTDAKEKTASNDPRLGLRCIARPAKTYSPKCDCWQCALKTASKAGG